MFAISLGDDRAELERVASAANTRSIAVAKRLGMTRDGVMRQNYVHRGVRHDTEIWSVLAPEWEARAGR